MPIANRFLRVDEFAHEFLYDLSVAFCPGCHMVQLDNLVPPEMMFNEDYAYLSSISTVMADHFRDVAAEVIAKLAGRPSPFVVELGCNDGIMLRHIAERGIRHLGVEPSSNVAALAARRGVEVLCRFFNAETAEEIRQTHGEAAVICGANVMCHIDDVNSVFEGVSILLARDGVLFFEDPYLLDIIRQTSFDQIYDEHVYYFSTLSVSRLAERHGMQLVDVKPLPVHGGSMRYYIKRGRDHSPSENVARYSSLEREHNLDELLGYSGFRSNVDKVAGDLKSALEGLKGAGHRVAGYGATSKSTTLYNYAGIGPDLIEYVSDTTPTKVGKYTPGTHIPIRSHDHFLADSPPYTLLLAWNHKREIYEREESYRRNGGKFITFFPELTIE